MAYENDIYTRNEDSELAVRVVTATEGTNTSSYDDVFTRDTNGKLAVRVVGAGGGDSHNLGWFATPQALSEAYPTAESGDYAIVGSTDTVWVWDTDTTAWKDTDTKGQVESVNGQTGIVSLGAADVGAQPTLVSGTNIKTVDGNSLLGLGNLELSTYLPYPAGWTTNSTTKAFCDGIAADTTAVKGKAYLGEVTFSDLPSSMVNGEVVVEIMDGTTAQDKVIVLSLKSGNVAPYAWQYVYWDNGTNVSGWKTWQETLVSGTNIKTINNTSILGSGNITVDSLPSQTSQSGKYLTTDGTSASWGSISFPVSSVNNQTGAVNLTASNVGAVPQLSTLPTAGVDYLGQVVQFVGTTGTYTNGYFYECVSDGQQPATYSWVQTNVQPTPSGLPSQSGNNGKFLKTNGTTASWSDDIYAGETTLTHKFDENDTTWFIQIPAKSDTSKALLDIHFYTSIDNEYFYPSNSYMVHMNFVGSANTQSGGIKYISAGNPMDAQFHPYYYFGNDNDGGLALNLTLSELPEGITEKYFKCVIKYTSEITGAESVSESDFWDLSPNWVNPLALMPNPPSSNMESTLIGAGGSAYWADSCQPVPVYEDSPDKKYVIVQNGGITTVDPIQAETIPGLYGVQVGTTIQYIGTTSGSWVNGYFYQLQLLTRTTTSLTVTQTTGSGLTITADKTTYENTYGDTYSADFDLTYEDGEWLQDGYAQDISRMGISITGTPQDGDVLTVHYEGLEYYSWVRIDVQPAPSGLPSQTGQSGKFLTTDGTDASWSDKPLVNKATGTNSLSILGASSTRTGDIVIGVGAAQSSGINGDSVMIGRNAGSGSPYFDEAICIGTNTRVGTRATAIGAFAQANGTQSIQIGYSKTNSDANTFKVGNANGNFEIMSANGTIPTDRFTTTPVADGTYVPTLTISSGVASRSWAAPSGGSVPTLTWYSVSTAGNTLTIADTSSAHLVKIYKNGLLLQPTEDYTISGTTLTTVGALVVGDKITTEVF